VSRIRSRANRGFEAPLKTWLPWVIPTWLAFAIFLRIGPELQRSISGLFLASGPTVFDAVFGKQGAVPLSVGHWLAHSFSPAFLFIALLATLAAMTGKTVLIGALRAALVACIGLSLSDAFLVNIAPLSLSIFFNILGTPFVWLFFVGLAMIDEVADAHLPALGRWAYAAAAMTFALAVSLAAFVIFHLFLNITPVHIRAEVEPPAAGEFLPVEAEDASKGSDKADQSTKPMVLWAPETSAEAMRFTSPRANMVANWKRIDPDSRFQMRIGFMADCPADDRSKLPKISPGPFKIDDVKVGIAAFSPGRVIADAFHEKNRQYSVTTTNRVPFWLKIYEQDEAGETVAPSESADLDEVQLIAEPDARVSFDPREKVDLLLTAPLIKYEKKAKTSSRQSRILTFEVDGKIFGVRAGGANKLRKTALRCRRVDPIGGLQMGKTVEFESGKDFSYLSAIITIEQNDVPTATVRDIRSRMILMEGAGWISIYKPRFGDDDPLGKAESVFLWRGLKRLVADGQEISVRTTSEFGAIGQFDGVQGEQSIRFDGTAQYLWLEGRRLNPTPWERLSIVWQVPLAGSLLTVIGLLARHLWPMIWGFIGRNPSTKHRLRNLR